MAVALELNLARNMFGTLPPDIRRRILHYLAKPTVEGWDDIHCILIGWGNGAGNAETIWQGVLAVDPTFPTTGRATDLQGNTVEEWSRIPSAELVKQALVFATH